MSERLRNVLRRTRPAPLPPGGHRQELWQQLQRAHATRRESEAATPAWHLAIPLAAAIAIVLVAGAIGDPAPRSYQIRQIGVMESFEPETAAPLANVRPAEPPSPYTAEELERLRRFAIKEFPRRPDPG